MRDWQLQLQQEGDDCALPVETRELEILEGRYRLRIGQLPPDSPLRCRIVYRNPQEPGQPRRVHETELRSDASGDLEVFPFTYLRPGIWDLDWPEHGESSVRLQVLARDAGEDLGEAPRPEVSDAAPARVVEAPEPAPRLRILLRQSRFWVQPGELFTLSGELQVLGPSDGIAPTQDLTLAIDLQQTEGWQSLHRSSLVPQSFPWAFSLPVTVPTQTAAGPVRARVQVQWGDQHLEEQFELSLFQPELPGPTTIAAATAPEAAVIHDSPEPEPLPTPEPEPPEAIVAAASAATPPVSFTLSSGNGRRDRSLDLPFIPTSPGLTEAAIPAAVPFPEPSPPNPVPAVPALPFLDRLQSMIESALPAPAQPETEPPSESATPPATQATATAQDDDAIPAPGVEIDGPLLSGGDVDVRVSLPRSDVRRVVKLWLQDNRQQRRLGQLRLVADFSPAEGEQAIASLTVSLPDDLSDLSLEAVTIELPSQRESQTVHHRLG